MKRGDMRGCEERGREERGREEISVFHLVGKVSLLAPICKLSY